MLNEYLAEFAAAEKPTKPSQPGLVEMLIARLQGMLAQLGDQVAQDGQFGPKTKAAWAARAKMYSLNQAFDRASPNSAWVHPNTVKMINAFAQNAVAARPAMDVSPRTTTPGRGMLDPYSAALRAKAAPSAPAALRASAPVAAAAADGTVVKTVRELQQLLYGVGWTKKKLKLDGKYGEQTKKAWTFSANLRKLPAKFERVTGETARVAQSTYDRIRADGTAQAAMPQTAAPTKSAATPTGTKPAASSKTAPATTPAAVQDIPGTLVRSVDELQQLLYGVGWTTKKLKATKIFDTQTAKAWGVSANIRKLPTTFTKVTSTTARVAQSTYDRIKSDGVAQASKDAGKKPGAPSKPSEKTSPAKMAGSVEANVAEMQSILVALGASKTSLTDGKFGPVTQKAWEGAANARGLNPGVSGKTGARTATVFGATYDALNGAAKKAKPAEAKPDKKAPKKAQKKTAKEKPIPTTPADRQIIDVIVKRATVSVPVLNIQRTLAYTKKIADGDHQGIWNSATESGFLALFFKDPAAASDVRKAIPSLLSVDNRTLRMWPDWANVIELGVQRWLAARASGPAPEAPTTSPDAERMPPVYDRDAPVPSGGGGGGGGVGPYYEETPSGGGGGGAAPAEEPPAEQASPTETWDALVSALRNFAADAPKFEEIFEAGKARGPVHPAVQAAYDNWMKSGDRLRQRLAQLIESNQNLQASLDTVGPTVGFAGVGGRSEFEAMFASLESASIKAVELLKEPLVTPAAPPATMQGLGQAAQVAGWAARLASPAFKALIALLNSRTVAATGTAAVLASGAKDVINSDLNTYSEYQTLLAKMLSDGAITQAEYDALSKGGPQAPGIPWGYITLGAIALGGTALYFKNRPSRSGGHNAARR